MNEFEHLIIQLAEIKLATSNFSNNVIIGSGGFGKVYVGEVSHSKGQSMVAIKRLDRKFGQGDSEFWKEIMMLSRYTHKNLISLLGFCDEDGEKILVYEHASNGSLDRHLGSTSLTWAQRIKICLDAAKGIRYLHDHKGTQQRVLHRDIKSANILLDHNWNAKVSDMGLSKLGPANQLHTNFYTNVVGTPGYCDPQYMITYMLTKESDVYSFGVVLFEVLSGRLCYEVDSNHQLHILVPRWKTSYILKKLHEIIFKDLIPPMNKTSLETIANTAFQCVQESREQRPKISLVVKKLENALKLQERYEMNLRKEYHNKEIIKVVETSSNYTYLKDLISKSKKVLLSLGTTVKEGTKQKDVEDGDGGGSGATTARKGKALLHGLEGNMPKFVRFEGIMSFTAVDLLRAMGMIIGKNSYGTVYKVELKDGELAVRRLRETSTKDQRVFKTKANVIGKIRHPNLLAMRAYYIGPEGQKLLVFDYMPKGNLAAFLHARGPETPVDWQTRMRIAKGIARGLFALHTYHKILHGNLTTNNVLLDKNINPKIADFGLSSLMTAAANSQVRARTGALGYRAPELSNYKKANTKTDVYSLGVIMLELLTGKQPGESMNGVDLPQWVASVVKKERTNEVFDLELMKDASAIGMGDELLNTLKLALRCADPSPSARPEVQQVLDQLEKKGSITGPRSSAVGKRHEFQL